MISSIAILTAFIGIIIYFVCILMENKCSIINITSKIPLISFAIYFIIDITISCITIFKFNNNLKRLFKLTNTIKIIHINIKYSILFIICFTTTIVFALIGSPLNGYINKHNRIYDVIIHNMLIDFDVIINCICLYMSVYWFGQKSYEKYCNKLHNYFYNKYVNKIEKNKTNKITIK